MAEKRIVLITGADGALGKEVVRKLLQEGWHLHACVHHEQAGLDLQKAFPEADAGSLTVLTGDVTDAGAVREFVNSARNFHAVVHIAGGFRAAGEFEKNTDADFNFLVNLNIGLYAGTRPTATSGASVSVSAAGGNSAIGTGSWAGEAVGPA